MKPPFMQAYTSSHAKISTNIAFGEAQRKLEKKIYEQKRLMKTNDDRNALFSHMLDLNNIFNFFQATLIKPIHCKKSCRLLESAVISKTNLRRHRRGFCQISPYLVDIIRNENTQNRKRIKRDIFPLGTPIILRSLSLSLFLPPLFTSFPSRHHILPNILLHLFPLFPPVTSLNYFHVYMIKNL